jgi:hypothetical protein
MAKRQRFASFLVLFATIACGSDDDPRSSASGGSGGTGGASGSGGSAGTGGVSGSGGSAGSGGSGGSAGAPLGCGEAVGVTDLEGGSWDDRFTIAGFSSRYGIAPAVYDFARDTDGSLIAAGRFDFVGGDTVPPLMRWKNGAWEPERTAWALPPPADGFSAIAVSPDGELALATNDSFGERNGEVWLDDAAGLHSIGAFDGQVRSLAFYDDKLWVAGLFLLDDGTPIEGLAVYDGSGWSAAPGGALEGTAFELLVVGDELFVGGAFSKVGGVAAANVAAYDGVTWTAYDFDDAMAIYALARTAGGDLYAGGAYGAFEEAGGIARWSGTTWQTVGGGLGQLATRGVVTDLVAHGEIVDATGCFSRAGGLESTPGSIASRSVARWSGSAWQSLDDDTQGVAAPWFQPAVCGDEALTAIWDVSYQRLAIDGQRLIAGGSFAGIDGVLSQAIAAHDGTAWVAQGEGKLGIGGSIDRIGAGGDGCSIYGVGTFTHVAGEPATGRVVKFNGAGWDNLSDSLPSDAWCPALDVSAEGEVAVGCMLFPPTGDAVGAILRHEGNAMVAADTPDLPPAMAVGWSPSGKLWIAGAGATGYLATLDGDALSIVEDGFDASVGQIDVASDDDIVVAGAFTRVGSLEASRIAHWDGSKWSALGDGLPGQVLALERDGATTYASSYDEGSGALLLGAFDGTSWKELATAGSGLTPKPEFSFNTIRAVDGGLIVAGSPELDDGSARGAFTYRDGAFQALHGGVSAISIDGVAVTGDAVWLAGVIAAAGSEDATVSSVGIARYALAGAP